ncbi:hypothetical protein RCC89_18625 [Cytophagaceae bacterium ABcell3]|nr:hypothetical protein RCC89_18625 [Cytophagaceae bacterium ABcell3]
MDILSYSKLILEKVSFDRGLFEKELKKSLINLNYLQQRELIDWCRNKFGKSRPDLWVHA